MNKDFTIYIDRLREGQTLEIEETTTPDFLDIHEQDLLFLAPVSIHGKAYLADEHLVLQLDIQTQFTMPCAICNEKTTIPIDVKNFYHTEPLSRAISHTFDYTEPLREAILLQVPPFAECHDGHCPERKVLTPFLKKKEVSTPSKSEHIHYPFADL